MTTWKDLLLDETRKPYYRRLIEGIKQEREAGVQIYPEQSDVFNCFKLTALENVQVVILGQDPYHNIGQAHGLSFSVKEGVSIPPSLKNIFKEIQSSYSKDFNPKSGNLESWARQGVLLLNTFLTVKAGQPLSHSRIGWDKFTDQVVRVVDRVIGEDCVFMLWGSNARMKRNLISKAMVLTAAHPSPFSASGFLGCSHFVLANKYLLDRGRPGIEWTSL